MNEYIIGNLNSHLLLSLKKKIPIITTKYAYSPYENYSKKIKILEELYPNRFLLESYEPTELGIKGKETCYSHDELKEVLLFYLELFGLLYAKEIASLFLDHKNRLLKCYGKGSPLEIRYSKLYILDSHKISYTEIAKENNNNYRIIDRYKILNNSREYFKKKNHEIYFFDGYMYVIFELSYDLLEEWEYSFSSVRRTLELPQGEFLGREIRPLFVRQIDLPNEDKSILYGTS